MSGMGWGVFLLEAATAAALLLGLLTRLGALAGLLQEKLKKNRAASKNLMNNLIKDMVLCQ